MKIKVSKTNLFVCFRPAKPRKKGNHENGGKRKHSLSRFFNNVLLGNTLTKQIRKRRTKNSELTKESGTKFDKDIQRTLTTVDNNIEDAVFPPSPSASPYSFLTQETNYADACGGCFKVAEVEQESGVRQPQMPRSSMVTNYIKRTFISVISHRYVIYTLFAIFGVTVFLRFNGIFLTCVWLYLVGDLLSPTFSGERETTS